MGFILRFIAIYFYTVLDLDKFYTFLLAFFLLGYTNLYKNHKSIITYLNQSVLKDNF